MTKARLPGRALWQVVLRLAAVLPACSARAMLEDRAARTVDVALPADAGAATRFVADLSANHPLWYALLGFVAVTIAALALSVIAGRLMKLLGYRDSSPGRTQGRQA